MTCVPAYFFTALWHHPLFGITVINVITVVPQTTACIFYGSCYIKHEECLCKILINQVIVPEKNVVSCIYAVAKNLCANKT